VYPGRVRRFPDGFRVPQMGWNQLEKRGQPRLLQGTAERPFVYFANSYYVPEEVAGERAAALSEYGIRYTAAIESGNVFGVQFHPEKSSAVGQQIVRNFLAC
jgi:imidazole glycerol phosphate synthase glutamine amidotransferase subunit